MCQCTPEIRTPYCNKCRPLEEKLKTMPVKELKTFVYENFHSIKYTKSFDTFLILLNRLKQAEEKLSVTLNLFDRIYKLLSKRK